MPVEEFISTVFCWVDIELRDVTRVVKLRRRGYQLQLSDAEVITMELVGEFLSYDGDEAIWAYVRRHWAPWFPGLSDQEVELGEHSHAPLAQQVCYRFALVPDGKTGTRCRKTAHGTVQ